MEGKGGLATAHQGGYQGGCLGSGLLFILCYPCAWVPKLGWESPLAPFLPTFNHSTRSCLFDLLNILETITFFLFQAYPSQDEVCVLFSAPPLVHPLHCCQHGLSQTYILTWSPSHLRSCSGFLLPESWKLAACWWELAIKFVLAPFTVLKIILIGYWHLKCFSSCWHIKMWRFT